MSEPFQMSKPLPNLSIDKATRQEMYVTGHIRDNPDEPGDISTRKSRAAYNFRVAAFADIESMSLTELKLAVQILRKENQQKFQAYHPMEVLQATNDKLASERKEFLTKYMEKIKSLEAELEKLKNANQKD